MNAKKKFVGEVKESNNPGSALKVNDGVDQPPQVNPQIKKIRKSRQRLGLEEYTNGILNGDINILSRAITLIESKLPEDNVIAQEIIEKCLPHSGNSIRIGITGVPGVGKSTFIEALGLHIISNHKLAVLAVDPSSDRSGGSILGDKTRMEKLSASRNAFIRPSPSAGSLGGVARKTRETIILCEAAGYDVIFIETVGVGQSETAVHSMVDFFLLLMLAGAGDELQGIKRGIMEMADAIAITKADSSNIQKAEFAKVQYQNALHLFPPQKSGWTPKVLTCSALEGTGISEIWNLIQSYLKLVKTNNYFNENRRRQDMYWFYQTLENGLKDKFFNDSKVKHHIEILIQQINDNKLSSFKAAIDLLKLYFGKNDRTRYSI
jgi:LAO/AO transport system kinase